MCVSELLQNAVEHAQAEVIELQLSRTDSAVTLAIRDNGSGIESSILQDPANSGGLGLQIVHSLVTGELQGSVEIVVADGSVVTISVPVSSGHTAG
jgi:two-component sensor histidine kinase